MSHKKVLYMHCAVPYLIQELPNFMGTLMKRGTDINIFSTYVSMNRPTLAV